jgi:redox-sensitive bicupin YhaK (pirin superfamily)
MTSVHPGDLASTATPEAPSALAAQAALASHPDLVLRPSAERFHSSHGWLESWHSFSFAGHDHPAWRGFGPLLVINDDRVAAGRGFGMHPHRDMEIITVMVEGVLHHRDSMGHSEALQAGEVQRMSAGTGIVHSEINEGAQSCRLLQIWITPSHQGLAPSYGQKPFAIGTGWTLLVDPQERDGAMAIDRPVRIWRAQPHAGDQLALPGAAEAHGWIQIITGDLEISLEPLDAAPARGRLGAGDGLGLAPGMPGLITAGAEGADLLLFELR